MNKVLLQQCNAQPHLSIRTRKATISFGWTTVLHPQHSPDLAPSDYHLFGAIKDALRGKHYGNDEEVKIAVKNWLCKQLLEFYKTGIHAFIQWWNTAIEYNGNYVEKKQCQSLACSLILMNDLFCSVVYF